MRIDPCVAYLHDMAMLTGRALRYTRTWLTGRGRLVEKEILLDRDGTPVAGTIIRPKKKTGPLPAWVVLHGITRHGHAHEQLVRFTRALASSGLITIVPEVPEWRALSLAPHLASPTVKAAIAGLAATGEARDESVGVIGFSFGAPHAITATADPELKDMIAGAAGFGGYFSLESTFRFMMSGRHGWQGRHQFLRPDPYGRWIAAANYLTAVPDYEDATDVASALRHLASHAAEAATSSQHALFDPIIGRFREGIAESRRDLFDLFAPLADAPTNEIQGSELAEGLAAAARRLDPLIDPAAALASVEVPVHLLHGRHDRLIPFTESERMWSTLPRRTSSRLTVTRLFGHSGQDPFPFSRAVGEVPRFIHALSALLDLV